MRTLRAAIVAELTARRVELVVVAVEWLPDNRRGLLLGSTTHYVLKHSPARVMLIGAGIDAAPAHAAVRRSDPVFRSGSPSEYWPTGEFVDRVQTELD